MAPRFIRKMALLAKISTSYGVDPTPVGGTNAIRATNVTLTPMAGGQENRDLLLPWLGHQGVILTGEHVQLEFSVEMAGAGAAGSVPGYGPLLRACGLAQTINAGVGVDYDPVSSAFEDVAIYYNLDGVRHIMLGARGNLSFELVPQRIPRFRFRFLGLSGAITDTALPAVTLTGFKTPLVVNKANTTFSLHGYAGPMESFSLDMGNDVSPRLLVNSEDIQLSDRQVTGSAVVEAATLATKNWFQIATDRTRDALAAAHGVTAGNIIELAASAVEIGRPTQGESQKIANYTLPIMVCPTSGNDDFKLTVR